MDPICQFVATKPPPQQPPRDRCGERLAGAEDRELLGAPRRALTGQRAVHGLDDVPAFAESAQLLLLPGSQAPAAGGDLLGQSQPLQGLQRANP